jgi:hypothetical protein
MKARNIIIASIILFQFMLVVPVFAMGEAPPVPLEDMKKVQEQEPPLQTPQDLYHYRGIRICSYEVLPRVYLMGEERAGESRGITFLACADENVYWEIRVITKEYLGKFGSEVYGVSGAIYGGYGKNMNVLWSAREQFGRPIPSGEYQFVIVAWDKLSGRASSVRGPLSLVKREKT